MKNPTIAWDSGSEPAYSSPRVMSAPSRPTSAPSNTNGQRMNASDAPTSRMISISSARATTASRIVLTMMNSTIRPTIPTIATPAVRTKSVTVSTRFTSAVMLSTLRTMGSSLSASVTVSSSDGLVSLTLMLAYSGFDSRYCDRSSRPWAACVARNRSSAASREMNSTDATSGIASTDATSVSTWPCVAVFWR